jgi:peptide-methionine (S)-S-oxide reductase
MVRRSFLLLVLLMACHAEAPLPTKIPPGYATAIFAGGCFWCMEPAFEKVKGVVAATSGYTGGHTVNPTYESVSYNNTGHYESVEVLYDPKQISCAQLLDVFWHNVDPTDTNGQFCDDGPQYLSAIFYGNESERQLAARSKQQITDTKHIVVATLILPAARFYPAEEYHQDYYKKNPVRYEFYRFNCGRDHRLEQIWGKAQ